MQVKPRARAGPTIVAVNDPTMSVCFHCGLPAPGGVHRATVLGAEREFCCAGCRAVASTIAAAGLGGYYQTRTETAACAEPAVEEKRSFDGHKGEASLVLGRVRCAACLWLIEERLRRLPGVTRAAVNYATQRAQVAWDPARTGLARIVEALREVGYDAFPYDPARAAAAERRERRAEIWRLFVAAFGAMQVMMYAFPAYFGGGELSADAEQLMRWAGLLLTLPVVLISCAPFFSGALRELRLRRVGLDTPIALGLAGAFLASAWATVAGSGAVYFDSICMLAFLLLGARYLEGAARRRAGRMLDPLLRLEATSDAIAGDIIAVAPGKTIPVDGVVVAGDSSADESLLTGESRAVRKGEGDELLAGSVNLEQPLSLRVTRTARLAERGAASRPPLVDAADRVARHLTWIIVVTALAAGAWSHSPWVAIAVLVVACPCALALAAPIVLTRASGELLAHGVLLTRARALEALARVTDVVLDKTGTLTHGEPRVTRVTAFGAMGENACLKLAGSLESSSRHPLARAFIGWRSGPIGAPRDFPGEGIEARVESRRVRIGTEAFCQALCGFPPAGAAHPNFDGSHVFLADERGWLAAFELADTLRPEAAGVVASLRRAGLTVHLASGDRREIGETLAHALWIDNCTGAMSPQDKYAYVAALQRRGGVVAMVGDGLNDAPVLARADVSFAMGAGADAAQLRADLVLLGNSLDGILAARTIAASAMRVVRQNIGWALAYNTLALPLAAFGLIGPWEAALAMGASSLTVLLNALRPLDTEPEWKASTSSSPSPSPSYS
jgi:Cu2+-exporting ATPase